MHVTLVNIRVQPQYVADFLRATRANHLGSINEPGNLRFDVLQSPQDAGTFVLYEAYASAEHAAAHKLTPHYLLWRDTVAPWMAVPRSGVTYHGLMPA